MQDELNQDIRDIRTVHVVLQGRHDQFRDIVHRYTDPIFSLAYRMTGSPEDAEEAVQEIFSRAFERLSSFDTERRFFPWLYTIALNHLRSKARSGSSGGAPPALSLDDTLERHVSSPASAGPEHLALRREAERSVLEALGKLRPEHREVFILRHMEGLGGREIAEMLDIPENTVKTYAHRARRQLRELILSGDEVKNEID